MKEYRRRPKISDAKLVDLVLERVKLTDDQTTAFVHYATLLTQGLPHLPKTVLDHAHALLRAAGISIGPPRAAKPKASVMYAGMDCYSTDRTPGTEVAEQVLSRRPSRPPNRPKRAA